jgi:D-sedoheptulose 7-phosphate isomerase
VAEVDPVVVRERLQSRLDLARQLQDDACVEAIVAMAKALVEAYERGNKALLFGNGGSAAEAQHIAAEFVGRYLWDRPALPALALTANSSTVTAVANDLGFAETFARQIEGFGRPGDIAIALSTSGRSANVIRGLEHAKRLGLATIALTGGDGGSLADSVDICIKVPASATPVIQEGHLIIGHLVCEIVERALFGSDG